MNDYSNMNGESEFRNEMTVEPHEGDEGLEMAYEDRTHVEDGETVEPDESMDGDFDSGMASAGFGTDEDYGYYGGGEE